MSLCLSTVKDVLVFVKSAESFCKFSPFDEMPQDNINEDQLDIGYSSSSKTSKKKFYLKILTLVILYKILI